MRTATPSTTPMNRAERRAAARGKGADTADVRTARVTAPRRVARAATEPAHTRADYAARRRG